MNVFLAIAMFITLSSCSTASAGNVSSADLQQWNFEDSLSMQLVALHKEIESLKCEQTTIKDQQHAIIQMLSSHSHENTTKIDSTALVYPPKHEEPHTLWSSEEEGMHPYSDPCLRYTVLDQDWRATNSTTKSKACDRHVKWKGWYRLFYKGKSVQMPERCVPSDKCGTHSPLWLAGTHPRMLDGVVTRSVCGSWKKKCCAFKSTPIKVKKCRGNYYVYQFVKPTACMLAYCSDINTIVCGRCRRSETCVSRDKINWRCKRKRRVSSKKVHFFASYPGRLSGKVNKIKYSKVLVNIGKGFNKKTGVFRAPVKGVYQFFFSTQAGHSGDRTDLWLVVNRYWVAVSHTYLSSPSTVGSLSTYMTFLRKGALVYVTHNCGSSWANAASMTITFGGSLLAQWK